MVSSLAFHSFHPQFEAVQQDKREIYTKEGQSTIFVFQFLGNVTRTYCILITLENALEEIPFQISGKAVVVSEQLQAQVLKCLLPKENRL